MNNDGNLVSIDMKVLKALCVLLIQAQTDRNIEDEKLLLQSITKLLHNPLLYKKLTVDSRTTTASSEKEMNDESFLFPFEKYIIRCILNAHKHSVE